MEPTYNHTASRSLDIIALVLALAAIIAAVVAIQSANDATAKIAAQDARIKAISAQQSTKPANSAVGTGPNNQSSAVPNAAGQ